MVIWVTDVIHPVLALNYFTFSLMLSLLCLIAFTGSCIVMCHSHFSMLLLSLSCLPLEFLMLSISCFTLLFSSAILECRSRVCHSTLHCFPSPFRVPFITPHHHFRVPFITLHHHSLHMTIVVAIHHLVSIQVFAFTSTRGMYTFAFNFEMFVETHAWNAYCMFECFLYMIWMLGWRAFVCDFLILIVIYMLSMLVLGLGMFDTWQVVFNLCIEWCVWKSFTVRSHVSKLDK